MNLYQLIIELIGFDPLALAGRPTGYSLVYLVCGFSAIITGLLIASSCKKSNSTAPLITAVSFALISAFIASLIFETLFVSYQNFKIIPADTKIEETFVVATPFPVLCSEGFSEYRIGTIKFRTSSPTEFARITNLPENIVATSFTIALHVLFTWLTIASITAATMLAIKRLPPSRQ